MTTPNSQIRSYENITPIYNRLLRFCTLRTLSTLRTMGLTADKGADKAADEVADNDADKANGIKQAPSKRKLLELNCHH